MEGRFLVEVGSLRLHLVNINRSSLRLKKLSYSMTVSSLMIFVAFPTFSIHQSRYLASMQIVRWTFFSNMI